MCLLVCYTFWAFIDLRFSHLNYRPNYHWSSKSNFPHYQYNHNSFTVVFTEPTQASRRVNLAFKPWKMICLEYVMFTIGLHLLLPNPSNKFINRKRSHFHFLCVTFDILATLSFRKHVLFPGAWIICCSLQLGKYYHKDIFTGTLLRIILGM